MTSETLRTHRTATIELQGPVEEVFELFEPIGEAKWSEGWHPSFVYPRSGITEEGMVFTTSRTGSPDTVWIATAYDKERHMLEYHRVSPGFQATGIKIACTPAPNQKTRADVTYIVTSLSQDGSEAAAQMTEAHYSHWMSQWEAAINYYLKERRALNHHGDAGAQG